MNSIAEFRENLQPFFRSVRYFELITIFDAKFALLAYVFQTKIWTMSQDSTLPVPENPQRDLPQDQQQDKTPEKAPDRKTGKATLNLRNTLSELESAFNSWDTITPTPRPLDAPSGRTSEAILEQKKRTRALLEQLKSQIEALEGPTP